MLPHASARRHTCKTPASRPKSSQRSPRNSLARMLVNIAVTINGRQRNGALSIIARSSAMHDDPQRASTEYLAQFRSDIVQFLTVETIAAAQRQEPLELQL